MLKVQGLMIFLTKKIMNKIIIKMLDFFCLLVCHVA